MLDLLQSIALVVVGVCLILADLNIRSLRKKLKKLKDHDLNKTESRDP